MGIDPRGPRFAALVTTVVLAAVLIVGSVHPAVAAWLIGAQAAVFATAVLFGMRAAPYGIVYRTLIKPRLGPPRELEPPEPPRFAQGVGLLVAVIGVAGYAAGITPLGVVAAAFGLIAAFLNGAFGICLGCEMYLIIRRIMPARQVSGAGHS
jgi:Domain of unknown function (DUF4395)